MPWSKISAAAILESPDADAPERPLATPEALREALSSALAAAPSVFVMGQGVDDPGGNFGTTRNLHKDFGSDRVFDTPLAESALAGIAMGAALGGMRPVYMHNRPDFLYLTMDQLINHASKWHYMFGGALSVPMVVWACIGRGWGSGAQHSQALQGLFMQFPGLKFVMPSNAADSKGLMLAAIADPNPVLIMEYRHCFKYMAHVPEVMEPTPIGRGIIRRRGRDVTIVAVSYMVIEAIHAANELAERGVDCEVIDLRSLRPLDTELVLDSVRRTGRLVVADMAWPVGGVNAEICALAAEHAFDALRAPVARVSCPDTPTPSGYTLEAGFYPDKTDIERAVFGVMAKSK